MLQWRVPLLHPEVLEEARRDLHPGFGVRLERHLLRHDPASVLHRQRGAVQQQLGLLHRIQLQRLHQAVLRGVRSGL
jgi:hypothetical protein